MPERKRRDQPLVGTAAYDNWRAFNADKPVLAEYEHPIYTDALLTGAIITGLGPYQFFNLVPFKHEPGRVRAAFILRWSVHTAFGGPEFGKTEQSRYHGGWVTDEVTALASLRCGVRLHSGGETRWFSVGGDPKGRPIADSSATPEPVLNIPTRGSTIPGVAGEHSIMDAEEIRSFPSLKAKQAIALVRSARLYQDALWLAESRPDLCWLLLVSAVENAANLWRSGRGSALERLKTSHPKFVKYLEDTGVDGLPRRVAHEFDDSIGTTKKFVEFLVEYCPRPPEKRPGKWGQLDWSTENLSRAFRIIYGHRSKALHLGIPFPAPMCLPPFKHETWEVLAERPNALGMGTKGAVWTGDDTPMYLHTFEHISRHVLNAWWSAMGHAAGAG